MFPGKPVRTRHGDGFILGAKPPPDDKSVSQASQLEKYYYVMIKGQTYELSAEAI